MVVRQLDGEPVPACAVVGQVTDTAWPSLTHVAVLDAALNLDAGDLCAVWESGPPIQQAVDGYQFVGFMPSLSSEEAGVIRSKGPQLKAIVVQLQIKDRDQYIIRPPYEEKRDPVTGIVKHVRCSCAGFALACYEAAGIDLVTLDENVLPKISFGELQRHNDSHHLNSERIRQRCGLDGTGPWSIVLAGYVLRSFERSDDEIRAKPFHPATLQDAHF